MDRKLSALILCAATLALSGCLSTAPIHYPPDTDYDGYYDKTVDMDRARRCVKGKTAETDAAQCAFRNRDEKDKRDSDPLNPRNVPQL